MVVHQAGRAEGVMQKGSAIVSARSLDGRAARTSIRLMPRKARVEFAGAAGWFLPIGLVNA